MADWFKEGNMPKGSEFKVPKTLAACADLLYTTRHARLALQKEVDAMEAQESQIKEHLINTISKSDSTGVAGKLARVSIVPKVVPQLADVDAFRAYVKKTGNWQLIPKSINRAAITEMWEAGKVIPGIEAFNTVTVSMNKV